MSITLVGISYTQMLVMTYIEIEIFESDRISADYLIVLPP
jgi:hypothetical protein